MKGMKKSSGGGKSSKTINKVFPKTPKVKSKEVRSPWALSKAAKRAAHLDAIKDFDLPL